MKKFFISSTILMLFLSSSVFALDCKSIDKQTILKKIPNNPFLQAFFSQSKIIHKRKINNLCEIILSINDRFMTCYVNKDFLIIGQMYVNRKMVNQDILEKLKKQKQLQIKKIFLSKLPEIDKLVAISYKPSKTAHKVLYMFTDPLCPFCHKAETHIKKLVKKYNVVLKIIFFSVHGKKGNTKSIEAICNHFTLDQYLSTSWRKQKNNKQCKKGIEFLKQASLLAKQLQLRGVPSFIFEDGTKVIGANMRLLENTLKKFTQK